MNKISQRIPKFAFLAEGRSWWENASEFSTKKCEKFSQNVWDFDKTKIGRIGNDF